MPTLALRHWPALVLGLAACAHAPSAPAPLERRALLVSFDALNEARALGTVEPAAIPTFRRFFAEASCTDGARPMFPSVTAAGHAALWTGAWGHTNGVSANTMTPLPFADFALTETRSGYDARQLRADPLWLAAARAGRRVTAHHVTQAPEHPGHLHPEGGRDDLAITRDRATLADSSLFVLNGYNRRLSPPQLISTDTHRPHPAIGWNRMPATGVPPMEISWRVGADSLHALVTGTRAYDVVHVGATRRLEQAVRVPLVPVEREAIADRPLARHFAPVLWLPQARGRAGVYLRLWSLAPSLQRLELYQSHVAAMESNAPATLRAYEDVVGAFVGNSAAALLQSGAFGVPLQRGGDGSAELKYLETAELSTRQMMRGTEWLWQHRAPQLHLDYEPIIDDLDHLWFGAVDDRVPGSAPALRQRVNALRSRGWSIADRRLAQHRDIAARHGALLIVSGDHGMRATWRTFAVNAVLREAGLLTADSAGRIVAASSRVLSPNGYFLSVNRTRYKDGIVAEAGVAALLERAEAALRAVRDADGRPVVLRTWRPAPNDSLGIGGPSGGDLYFDLAAGFTVSASARGPAVGALDEPAGRHGFPSTDADMRTVLCAVGPGVGGVRLSVGRLIDAAPTIAEWMAMPAPLQAVGRSRLTEMRTRVPRQ